MDGEEARRTIREFDQRLRERSETMITLFNKLSEQATILANSLERCLYEPSGLSEIRTPPPNDWNEVIEPHHHSIGRLDYYQLRNSHDWIISAWKLVQHELKHTQLGNYNNGANARIRLAADVIESAFQMARDYKRNESISGRSPLKLGLLCVSCGTWKYLDDIARVLQEAIRPPLFLAVPDEIHPPRHGYVNKGMLGRLVAADITDHIDDAWKQVARLSNNSEPRSIGPWIAEVSNSLTKGLSGEVRHRFNLLTRDAARVDEFIDWDPDPIRAYYILCINYLTEVQERMSDYAESAGQGRLEPTHSVNFHGGTFYGGQFASQIANIESSISTVVNQGDSRLGEALATIEQAVLEEPNLGEQDRSDLLESVEYLADAARTPPEKRSRGMMKAALAAITTAATTGTQLNQAMESWGSVLHGIL
ncbi:hypothetical protein [Nocardia terpenica]|uniref:hypothetical protein n=1 Tax=Nocardia terpenica TaxID=455432 RepID=UPI0012E8FE42|nr:hypothetical protein [Nocardia terpenica]NQE86270.1 hypothetical protein [Nocardia terpenica]